MTETNQNGYEKSALYLSPDQRSLIFTYEVQSI